MSVMQYLENIIKSKVISYANGTTLYSSSENKSGLIKEVNANLTRLLQNLNSLLLKVNAIKTKLLLISKCNASDFANVQVDNELLELMSETYYLGMFVCFVAYTTRA